MGIPGADPYGAASPFSGTPDILGGGGGAPGVGSMARLMATLARRGFPMPGGGTFPGTAGGFGGGTFPGTAGGFGGGFPGMTGGFPGMTGGFPGMTGGFPGMMGGFPGMMGGFPGMTGAPGAAPGGAGLGLSVGGQPVFGMQIGR
jgi:hypothetical protein